MLNIFMAQYKASLLQFLQYRGELVLWMFSRLIEPVIYIVVWSAVVGDGELAGFDKGDFAGYYLTIMIVNQMTFSKLMFRYDARQRTGSLSNLLLHPAPIILRDAADNLVMKSLTLLFLCIVVPLFVILLKPTISLNVWSVVLFVPILALAWMLNYIMDNIVAMLTFWTTRLSSLDYMFYILLLTFSGRFAPLELLPEPLRTLANILPFRWVLNFPAELAIGRLSPGEAMMGITMQALWIIILGVGLRQLWKSGVRHYGAVGG